MTPLICKCCNGHIDPVTMVCRYCDTAYVSETRDMPRIITSEPVTITAYDTDGRKICDFETITEESAIMTPNEARKKIGLNSLADFGISVKEATKSFMNIGRCGCQVLSQNEYNALSDEARNNGTTYYITCHHN